MPSSMRSRFRTPAGWLPTGGDCTRARKTSAEARRGKRGAGRRAGDLDDAPAVGPGDVAQGPLPAGHELEGDVVLDHDDGLVAVRLVDRFDAREVREDAADLADAQLLPLPAPPLLFDAPELLRAAILDAAAAHARLRVAGDGRPVHRGEALVVDAVLRELLLHELEPVRRTVQVDQHRRQVELRHGTVALSPSTTRASLFSRAFRLAAQRGAPAEIWAASRWQRCVGEHQAPHVTPSHMRRRTLFVLVSLPIPYRARSKTTNPNLRCDD